jgi:hypothetical protein
VAFCTKCGKALRDADDFCAGCGLKVDLAKPSEDNHVVQPSSTIGTANQGIAPDQQSVPTSKQGDRSSKLGSNWITIAIVAAVFLTIGFLVGRSSSRPSAAPVATSTTTIPNGGGASLSQAIDACQADGATVETAIAAFHAQNPSAVPTAANLVSESYLVSFPDNTSHYVFGIASGILYEAPPSVTTPAGGTDWNQWTGGQTCSSATVR